MSPKKKTNWETISTADYANIKQGEREEISRGIAVAAPTPWLSKLPKTK